jgi:hypothetical protein
MRGQVACEKCKKTFNMYEYGYIISGINNITCVNCNENEKEIKIDKNEKNCQKISE